MTGPLLLMAAMLLLILIASELFTNALEHLGDKLGISEGVTGSLFAAVGTALPETMVPLLALLSGTANASVNEIPIATELPEKVNSIIWVRRGRDTLALGNITGAMVFQGTLLPAIGILLTPWQPRIEVLTGVFVTLLAAGWLRVNTQAGGLAVWALLLNGVLYVAYLAVTLLF